LSFFKNLRPSNIAEQHPLLQPTTQLPLETIEPIICTSVGASHVHIFQASKLMLKLVETQTVSFFSPQVDLQIVNSMHCQPVHLKCRRCWRHLWNNKCDVRAHVRGATKREQEEFKSVSEVLHQLLARAEKLTSRHF